MSNSKARKDASSGQPMMALVVKMATAELPIESPTFTKLPNFRHTGPPSPTALSLQIVSQRRSSFGLASLFSTPLAKRKNISPPLGTNSEKNSTKNVNGDETGQISIEIRSRIKELSARTKLKKEHLKRNKNNCSSSKKDEENTEKHYSRRNTISRRPSLSISDNRQNSERVRNGAITSSFTRTYSMASKETNGNRRMNSNPSTNWLAHGGRPLPGMGSAVNHDNMASFGVSSVTIPHMDDDGNLNSHELNFLRYSAEGHLEKVKNIFEEQGYYLFHLNVNCVDSLDRTALSLALLNRHIDIVTFLLSEEVEGIELRDALFYAIECEFYDAIEMLLNKDSQISVQIAPGTTSPFEPGLTPMMLSANKNNYKILATLYRYNHRLSVAEKEILDESFDSYSWDAVMERLLHFRARASPAFMLLMYNESGMAWDPLNTAMDLFGELRLLAKKEREVDEAYLQMAEQCETFSLQLLQEVRSASELADLMRYDLDADPDEDDDPGESDRVIIKNPQKMRNYLKPIEKAIKYKMKDFVTSDNSQLALIYIQKGSLFRKLRGYKAFLAQIFLGLMFPFLSLAFVIAPETKLGKLMRNPTVKFACSLVSELLFVFMLLANTILAQDKNSTYLEDIPPILMVAYLWIIGKFIQEVREVYSQGLQEYLSDIWNWNDIFTILLFTGYMILRVLNKIMQDQQPGAYYWSPMILNPVHLSDICISVAYILIHLRILELLRADRRFGPLQVSLDLMTRDAIRFFVIFFIIFLAFGSGITELYAPFGENKNCVCNQEECKKPDPTNASHFENLTDVNSTCIPCKNITNQDSMLLTTLSSTFNAMFWTLFGYSQILKDNAGTDCVDGEYFFTEMVGTIIICMYHIIAIIVLVNMLIAMMSNSFQKTHDDSEREWKFHRTQLWLKFIRNEINHPPPMNIIPRPKQIRILLHTIRKKLRLCCRQEEDTNTTEEDSRIQNQMNMQRRRTGFDSNKMGECLAGALYEGETRYSRVLRLVVIRYLKKKVLNNEMVI